MKEPPQGPTAPQAPDEKAVDRLVALAIAALVDKGLAQTRTGATGQVIVKGATMEIGGDLGGSVLACCKVMDGPLDPSLRRAALGLNLTMLMATDACLAVVGDRLCVIARWTSPPPESAVQDLAEWIVLLADCPRSLVRLLMQAGDGAATATS